MAQGSTSLTSAAALPPRSGNPPPEVIWLHNGNEIQESEDFHFEQRGTRHSLCIQEVFPEDTGTYTCEAWNSAGAIHTQAMLTVQGEADQWRGKQWEEVLRGLSKNDLETKEPCEPTSFPLCTLCSLGPSQTQRPAPYPTSQTLVEWPFAGF